MKLRPNNATELSATRRTPYRSDARPTAGLAMMTAAVVQVMPAKICAKLQ